MPGFVHDHFLVATYEHMSSNATPTLRSGNKTALALPNKGVTPISDLLAGLSWDG